MAEGPAWARTLETTDFACPIAGWFLASFVAMAGLAAKGGFLELEGWCEDDACRDAGFGAGWEGWKKSRIDLLPTGGMIHFYLGTSLEWLVVT